MHQGGFEVFLMVVAILLVVGCNEVKLVGMIDGYVVIVYLILSTIYKKGNKIHTTGRGSRCVSSPVFFHFFSFMPLKHGSPSSPL